MHKVSPGGSLGSQEQISSQGLKFYKGRVPGLNPALRRPPPSIAEAISSLSNWVTGSHDPLFKYDLGN